MCVCVCVCVPCLQASVNESLARAEAGAVHAEFVPALDPAQGTHRDRQNHRRQQSKTLFFLRAPRDQKMRAKYYMHDCCISLLLRG
jgi:hypothetical protein